MDGIGDRVVNVGGGGGNWGGGQKQTNVSAVAGVISHCFRASRPGEDAALDSWVTQFENILTQSFTEHSLHDFKQGLYSLDGKPQFSETAFAKILETLSAMANHGPNATGYVLIGVADKDKDARRVTQIHGISAKNFRGFHVTGIEHEATLRGGSLDDYVLWITGRINNSSLDGRIKDDVCRSVRLVRYYDKAVLVLSIRSGTEPVSLSNKFYVRNGASTDEVVGAGLNALFAR